MPDNEKTYRVIIADASPDVRSALHCLIEQEDDCRVIDEAASCRALHRALAAHNTDIVFLDAGLPSVSSHLIKLLRVDNPHLAVIVMSQDCCPPYKPPDGACCVISKKDPPESVFKALKDARREVDKNRPAD